MLTLAFMVIFAAYGVIRAHNLGGKRADLFLYGVSFALAGFAFGMIFSLALDLIS